MPPRPRRTIVALLAVFASASVLVPTPARGGIGSDPLPRPAEVPLLVPGDYDPDVPAPLLILLHGYGGTGPGLETFVQLSGEADARGYFYSLPTGSVNAAGFPYWNATDACCDFEGSDPDHVAYLVSIIDHIEANYSIDPRRIHLVGYSNGGFMAHRMACDVPDRLGSVISIAGATWNDPALCPADGVAHVVQIHGTLDDTVLYEGGSFGVPYPGAVDTVLQWVDKMDCDPVGIEDPEPLNFTADVPGAETVITRYETCRRGSSAELWTVVGGDHALILTAPARTAIFDYLDAHRAPCPGDVDASGETGFEDLLLVLSNWGPCAPGRCAADLDGDGSVSFGDLLFVLANWGACT